jgi:tetraacyldisaccharide-1-P 4'-kinase
MLDIVQQHSPPKLLVCIDGFAHLQPMRDVEVVPHKTVDQCKSFRTCPSAKRVTLSI